MLYLQELTKHGSQNQHLNLSARLPSFLASPCQVNVTYQVEAKEDFYLMHLVVSGELTVTCQRCLNAFNLIYNNPTTIAVARDDERAEQLLEHYECIVSSNYQVNLEDLVIDELHLYVPQFHEETKDCDGEVNQYLTGKTESY
ncbi:DUF177 domain-containing protein [Legionella sp. km772]|uniref:YceD family protein n=1 Tax=Legionella sp. km772 TaxID=2498111 RepID=UPI000F8F12C6|nr:YceD family protein [Legionella sp. km772]RUR12152.1 metal-binding protein [Legionella sp. km772]